MKQETEEAKRLVEKYHKLKVVEKENNPLNYVSILSLEQAKQCALIAVDEIIKSQEYWRGGVDDDCLDEDLIPFWQRVKEAINNLK